MSCGATPSPPEVIAQDAAYYAKPPTWRQIGYLRGATKRAGKSLADLIRAGIEHGRIHESTPVPADREDAVKFMMDTMSRPQVGALFEIAHTWDPRRES